MFGIILRFEVALEFIKLFLSNTARWEDKLLLDVFNLIFLRVFLVHSPWLNCPFITEGYRAKSSRVCTGGTYYDKQVRQMMILKISFAYQLTHRWEYLMITCSWSSRRLKDDSRQIRSSLGEIAEFPQHRKSDYYLSAILWYEGTILI